MAGPDRPSVPQLLPGLLERMRHPQLFLLLAALLVGDLVFPDAIPFVDEIMLAILTVLVGTWRKPRDGSSPPPPPPALPGQ